jgi:hypothetical protein
MATASDLREIALALPEVEERITWESPTFRVRGRIFVILHPSDLRATIKAHKADQAELIQMNPDTFSPAPYTGRFGWISVRLSGVALNDLRLLVTEAWRQAAPRSLIQSYNVLSHTTPRSL